jgi:hypothetical protein
MVYEYVGPRLLISFGSHSGSRSPSDPAPVGCGGGDIWGYW